MTAAARPEPLDAVVLAAGLSRRAGTFKPAVEVAGRPLLGHAIAGLLPWCRQVVVVTGHEQGLVQGLVAGIAGAVTVHNPHYAGDMFLSVQAGAGALAADPAGFFVLPVDCPFVEPAVYRALVEAFAGAGGTRAVVPEHAGRGGHPVLLPGAARTAILGAATGTTLRTVIAACRPLRLSVDSPSVLTDLDTPDDLAGLAPPRP